MYLREEEQTPDHLLCQCKRLNNQRNGIIKQIKNTGGDWPTTNETLVNNYFKIFVNFVKSIDFYISAMTLCVKDRQIDR